MSALSPSGAQPARPVGPASALPSWRSALVVVAHPDDESFGLGAVISAFVANGASVHVLCLTRGEQSTLGADAAGDHLAAVRTAELELAGQRLGVSSVQLHHLPDGALEQVADVDVDALVRERLSGPDADGVLVFDESGVTGHPDHRAATRSAVRVAEECGKPVLAWVLPREVTDQLARETGVALDGVAADEVDILVEVDRDAQLDAVRAHVSQAVPGSILWRRLELLGARESLRWIRPDLPR